MGWYCDSCGKKNVDPWAGGQGQPAPHCDTPGCWGNGEPKCQMCGGERDRPRTMSDDSYSTFKCPHPFHIKSGPEHIEKMKKLLNETWDKYGKASDIQRSGKRKKKPGRKVR